MCLNCLSNFQLMSLHSGRLITYESVDAALRDRVPFFGVLSKSQFNHIVAPKMVVKKYDQGEEVVGDPKVFGVIKTGIVEAFDSKHKKSGALSTNSVGQVLGVMNHLVFKESRVSFTAVSPKVEVYEFPTSVLDDIMTESVETWTRTWQFVAFYCARLMSHDIFGSWTHPTKLAAAMETAEVTVLKDGEHLEADKLKGYVLVRGKLKRQILTGVASRLRWRRSAHSSAIGKRYSAVVVGGGGGGAPADGDDDDDDLRRAAEDVHSGDIAAPYIIDQGSYVSVAGGGAESLVVILPDGFKSFGRSAGVMSKERFTRRALLMGNAAAVNTLMKSMEKLTSVPGASSSSSSSSSHKNAAAGVSTKQGEAWGLRAAAAAGNGEDVEREADDDDVDVEEGGAIGAGGGGEKAGSFEDAVVPIT